MKLFRYRSTPIVLLFWLGAIWFLHQDVVSQSFLTKDANVDINDGALIMREDYLGFYLGNQKIGFSQFVLKEDSDDALTRLPGKYFIFNSLAMLKIQALGIPMEIKIQQKGEVNEDLSMRSFSFTFESSGQQLYTVGIVEGNKLSLKSTSAGETSRQVIDIPNPIYHTDIVHLLVAREGIKVGNTHSFPVFDPLTMSKDTMISTVESKETVILPSGASGEAYKINVNYKGMNTTVWIDSKGERFKENSFVAGVAFTALRESKEEATNMQFISDNIRKEPSLQDTPLDLDLVHHSKIPTKVQFRNPAAVQRMEARIIGASSDQILIDDYTQFLIRKDDESVIMAVDRMNYDEIISALPEQSPPFEPNAEMEDYLRDELLIQSSSPQIRNKALEITKDSKNTWEASEKIAVWLYRNIEKEMRVTIPSALEVLNSMKGDCNEHSTLFAALARSIGIPSKIAAGLVWQDDGFYYHAWNEVYVDGQWLPVDATLNRIKMDAAHIKLAEGALDSQTDIVNLIGKIDVEILSYKEDSPGTG